VGTHDLLEESQIAGLSCDKARRREMDASVVRRVRTRVAASRLLYPFVRIEAPFAGTMELLWRGLWGSQRAMRQFSSSRRMRMTTGQFRRLRLDSLAPFQRQKLSARRALSHGSGGVLHAPEELAKINAGCRLRMRRRCNACARLAQRVVVSYLGGGLGQLCVSRHGSGQQLDNCIPGHKSVEKPPQTRQIAYTTAIVPCARPTMHRPVCPHADDAIGISRRVRSTPLAMAMQQFVTAENRRATRPSEHVPWLVEAIELGPTDVACLENAGKREPTQTWPRS
jgi:hypothetical protein